MQAFHSIVYCSYVFSLSQSLPRGTRELTVCQEIFGVFGEYRLLNAVLDGVSDFLQDFAVGCNEKCRPAFVFPDPGLLSGLIASQNRILCPIFGLALLDGSVGVVKVHAD